MAPNHPRTIPIDRTDWPARGHVTSSRFRITQTSCPRLLFSVLSPRSVRLYICYLLNLFSLSTFVNLFSLSLVGNITSWLWFHGAQATMAECYFRLVSMVPQSWGQYKRQGPRGTRQYCTMWLVCVNFRFANKRLINLPRLLTLHTIIGEFQEIWAKKLAFF
jgi:hypothetical protein